MESFLFSMARAKGISYASFHCIITDFYSQGNLDCQPASHCSVCVDNIPKGIASQYPLPNLLIPSLAMERLLTSRAQ